MFFAARRGLENERLEKECFEASDNDVETREGSTREGSAASDSDASSTKSWNSRETPELVQEKPEPIRMNAMHFVMMQALSSRAAASDLANKASLAPERPVQLSANAPAFTMKLASPAALQRGYDCAASVPSCSLKWQEQTAKPSDVANCEENALMASFKPAVAGSASLPAKRPGARSRRAARQAQSEARAGGRAATSTQAKAAAKAELGGRPTAPRARAPRVEAGARWADILDESDEEP